MGKSVSLIKDSEAKVMAAAGCVNEGGGKADDGGTGSGTGRE